MNGVPFPVKALDCDPRQRAPADTTPPIDAGTRSDGFSVTRDESPLMKRLIPVIGSTAVAPISLHRRPLPVFPVSRINHPTR